MIPVYCAIPPTNIYGVKLYIVRVGEEELVKKRSQRLEREEHTHTRNEISGILLIYIIVLIRVNVSVNNTL